MTQADLYKVVRSTGCTISKREGEYRVNLPRNMGGNENTAYYTICRYDALNTAHAMVNFYLVNKGE